MILEMFCEGEGETLELSSLDKNYGLGENGLKPMSKAYVMLCPELKKKF